MFMYIDFWMILLLLHEYKAESRDNIFKDLDTKCQIVLPTLCQFIFIGVMRESISLIPWSNNCFKNIYIFCWFDTQDISLKFKLYLLYLVMLNIF